MQALLVKTRTRNLYVLYSGFAKSNFGKNAVFFNQLPEKDLNGNSSRFSFRIILASGGGVQSVRQFRVEC
jgi:hypothetical protein